MPMTEKQERALVALAECSDPVEDVWVFADQVRGVLNLDANDRSNHAPAIGGALSKLVEYGHARREWHPHMACFQYQVTHRGIVYLREAGHR